MNQNKADKRWADEDDGEGLSGAVLARLPELRDEELDCEPPKPAKTDGRILGVRLSRRLLVGCGLVLLFVAVYPFVFDREQPQGGLPPAPDAAEAPVWNAKAGTPAANPTTAGARAEIPAPKIPAVPTYDTATDPPIEIDIPSAPDLPGFSNTGHSAAPNRPMAVGGRGGDPDSRLYSHVANRAIAPLQPGVARLAGTIEKTTLRQTYDSTRSGLY